MVAALVAGPAISNTRAAPGERPLSINTAATGTDAVAQIYTGIETTRIISIPIKSFGILSAKKSLGTITEMRAAISKPIINQLEISCKNSINEYLNISLIPGMKPLGNSSPFSLFSKFFSAFSGSIFLVTKPPNSPVINATIGRIIAKGRPNIEYVTNIESTPVCGVEIKNETVEAFDAPCL